MGTYDPIAYIYEADVHCPSCAEARFGRSDRGFIAEGSEDFEGNPVGIIAPWDEWHEPSITEAQTLNCGTCSYEIDSLEAEAVAS